jgi:hypothetical protein
MKKGPEVLPALTSAQISRALGFERDATAMLHPTGALARCVVNVNGKILFTSYALPVVAMIDEVGEAVQQRRLSSNDATQAVPALTQAAFREWDRHLRLGEAPQPLVYSRHGLGPVVFDCTVRAARALKHLRREPRKRKSK